MHRTLENLSLRAMSAVTNGPSRLRMKSSSLVYPRSPMKRLKTYSWHKKALLKMRMFVRCTLKLMATSLQESKRIAITTGQLTRQLIVLVMESRDWLTVLQCQFMLNALRIVSLRLLSLRKQLKMSRLSLKTF